ncbi:class I SAM-dependent methyltransferase [Candidatus Bathyarchaeota archaeon]|nr:class I SAM-dependent methyltransferase [Candidatus Bathyarchaeota archaeon]
MAAGRGKREEGGNDKIRGWSLSVAWGDQPDSVAPYVPSPIPIIREMLDLAKAGPGDVLYDLGCGDGRILFTAVEEYNVDEAVGYDLNPLMVKALKQKIREKGLGDRIRVAKSNFFNIDLTPATIVTLYLTTSGNSKLRPKFEKELKGGARVVSHDFPIQGWFTAKPDGGFYSFGSHKVYLYVVPTAYKKDATVMRSKQEEDRWNRVRRLFTSLDQA